MRQLFVITVLLFTLVAPVLGVFAQDEDAELKKTYLYQWKDKQGNIHITDGLGNVPEQYRSKARRMETPKKDASEQEQREPGGQAAPYSPGDNTEAQKDFWQRRMRDARARVADAERRLGELEKEKTDLIANWGDAAYAPDKDRRSVGQIEQEMGQVRREISEARDQMENVIPEEARKQGVPPGWLRE